MKPKIFVFCNSCAPDWHSFQAMSEDGCFIAGHLCSHHAYAARDMGIDPDGWKHEIYEKHYPDGYQVVLEENPEDPSPEFSAAYERHKAWSQDDYTNRMSIHKKE